MDNFLLWFFTKHQLAAAVLFPELTLVWMLWLRHFGYAFMIVPWILLQRGISCFAILATIYQVTESW